MITTCELCGKSFETNQKRNLCEACSVAAEQRIYHPKYKPAPKIKKPKTRSFMTEVEDLGRKMGIGGYGQMMAMIKTRCQKSGLSVRSEFCHLKFVYEKEHGHD